MDLDLELKLVSQFPELCKQYGGDSKETCFAWGFECRNGWFQLVQETLEKIENIRKEYEVDVSIAQIKSKFAKLTIYLDFGIDEKSNKKIQEGINLIYSVVDDAHKLSGSISEVSGLLGEIRSVNGWMIVLTEEEYILAQEFGIRVFDKEQ